MTHPPPVPIGTLGPVEETMLITLWARAEETARPDAIVRDERAARLRNAIDFEFDRFRGGWKSQVGVSVRTRRLDELVGEHLARHDAPTVVNVGAGLDTRFDRVDDGRVRWHDLDAPAAAHFRRRVLSPISGNGRCTLHAGSLLEDDWLADLEIADPAQTLVVAEGVLMFFPAQEVRAFLERLARRLPGGAILFDGIGPLMVRVPRLHDTLPRTAARFRWGASPRGLARFLHGCRGCTLHSTASLLNGHRRRWRWMAAVNAVPWMADQFYLTRVTFDYPLRSTTGAPELMEYVTREEREELQRQLEDRRSRRRTITLRIAEARALGDLKENAEYHAAREDQGLNEAKIRDLERKLTNAVVTDSENLPEDMVFIGATVRLKDVNSGDEELYRLVGNVSGNLDDDVVEVTPESPLGEALMKARVGETVRVALRRGAKQFEIVGLE